MTFEVKHGSFGYGKGTVLNDISFSVSSGEVLAVLGEVHPDTAETSCQVIVHCLQILGRDI